MRPPATLLPLLLVCFLGRAAAYRRFNTPQGFQATQLLGPDIRDSYGYQWLHGLAANDHVEVLASASVAAAGGAGPLLNVSVVLGNFSMCWHYRVDGVLPEGACTICAARAACNIITSAWQVPRNKASHTGAA